MAKVVLFCKEVGVGLDRGEGCRWTLQSGFLRVWICGWMVGCDDLVPGYGEECIWRLRVRLIPVIYIQEGVERLGCVARLLRWGEYTVVVDLLLVINACCLSDEHGCRLCA